MVGESRAASNAHLIAAGAQLERPNRLGLGGFPARRFHVAEHFSPSCGSGTRARSSRQWRGGSNWMIYAGAEAWLR